MNAKQLLVLLALVIIPASAFGEQRFPIKVITSVNEHDDVRWKDLSGLDLSSRRGLIETLRFNEKTVWPPAEKMPAGPSPSELIEAGKNPGLGVRGLHLQGITGKSVTVAIIDQPLHENHPEFDGKIVEYYDTGCGPERSSMHGPAVASFLVGTTCGTAPDAKLYYAAAPSWKKDAAYKAKALNWIIEKNKSLPENEKIRVVSVSASPNQPSWANRQMWDKVFARAKAAGILVLDCTQNLGFIDRCWYNRNDPENVAKCTPGSPSSKSFQSDKLLVPTSLRTCAEQFNAKEFAYTYYGRGGLSWGIPYCAGVLAMGWQVNPELSAGQMKQLLFKSALKGKDDSKIIYPEKFIKLVKRTVKK